MKTLKNFKNFDLNEGKKEKKYEKGYKEIKKSIEDFMKEGKLKGNVILEVEGPSIIIELRRNNKCFNSDAMDKQFSNDLGRPKTDGLNKKGFMGDYTLLEEMEDQIRVLSSIINSVEDLGANYNRCYIAGENIVFEFFLN